MESIEIRSLNVTNAYMTYLFPFSFREKERKKLMEQLEKNHFTFFTLDNEEMQDKYYGDDIKIVHEELDQFFLPFIEDKLFPTNTNNRGFLRYSKVVAESFTYEVNKNKFGFIINSVDITLCPFGIGIITIRVTMDEEQETLTNIVDHIAHFRVLEPKIPFDKGAKIHQKNKVFETTNELVFDYLCLPLKPFIIHDEKLAGYYGSLPFFEDERMHSSIFLIADEQSEITQDQLYRLAHLDGRDTNGNEFISTSNPNYMKRYVESRIHDRWAPDTYTISSEHTQVTLSVERKEQLEQKISQFMSVHYYNLMLHYYYKIMLLKVSFEHSEVSWAKDKRYVEELIELISKFSSRYYFEEVSTRTEGKELTHQLREVFRLHNLFDEVKQTVDDLYRAQDNQSDKRNNSLLFMLTIFTVVSGIYGMNLVIEDWKGKTDWSKVPGYSFFEWISLITALTGIGLSIALIGYTGGKGIYDRYRKWKRDRS
ncbi:hypothetical protein SAMN05518871_105225 [Psychrobacillus sp. OK028]|uniref:hypothetical protein n=1 Tax=Psychrobacillus sp. OK028 TaxID=1884359 RepID=UPI0008877111|nr:hypothetical protein [Psychrobacillus sp. OK028]SDN47425.1 hypothetical protein SAMN05518871_105225 [Psychrobacillus sp. OK028]